MGQSSSRPRQSTADQQQSQPQSRRRLRTRHPRPSSFFEGSSRGRITTQDAGDAPTILNADVNNSHPSAARSRSTHLFSRPRPQEQQARSVSPPSRTPSALRRRGTARRIPTSRPSTFARRVFTRRRTTQEEDNASGTVAQSWSVEPRDSLDMAHAARDRSHSRLPDIPQDPFDVDVSSPRAPSQPENVPLFNDASSAQELRPSSSLATRLSALTPAREFSRFTSTIRRRHARRSSPGEQNAAMLQRLLSVAAAATAASLMGGNPEAAVNDLRRTAVAVDGEDGSFDNFLQALRNGRLASHLGRNSGNNSAIGDAENADANASNPNSLDFFRMFRFGPSQQTGARSSAPAASSGNQGHQNDVDDTGNTGANNRGIEEPTELEARTVSILIVGIRSLNQDADSQVGSDAADGMPSFIDALTNLNTTINVGLQDTGSGLPVGSPRNGLGLSAFTRARRASMGGMFAGRDRTRRARLSNTGRPLSEIGPPAPIMPDLIESPTLPRSIDEQMADDSPAPIGDDILVEHSTTEQDQPSPLVTPTGVPPSPVSSRFRFRDSWRDSWRHSWRDSWPSSRGANRRSMIDDLPEDDGARTLPRWSRRRSHSEAMRFGSGSSRRNGVVEPDHISPDGESNRSWIIYVLGGSYPENHPILTTPSLFTENPTYEDMLLLSSLLGPAKPPVAQQQDVDSSGGLFRIHSVDDGLVARAVHEDGDDGFIENIAIDPAQNCQICLSTYSRGEVTRRLRDCKHMFHRECVDEWLTTGRNSCPLCRMRGVFEKTPPPDPNVHMPGDPGSSRGAAAAAAANEG